MPTKKRPTPPTPTTPENAAPNGRAATLDYDSFLDRVRTDAGSLLPFVWAAEIGANGNTFGARLGKVPLQSLDDLDERLRAEWPGPRVLVLRTKAAAGGAIRHTGTLHLAAAPAAPAAPTGGADVATLAALVAAQSKQIEALTSRLAQPVALPAAPLGEQVGALASVAQVFSALKPGGEAAGKGLTVEDVQKLIDYGKAAAGGTSVGLEALRLLGPAGVDFLKASAGMLLVKINAATEDKPK